MMKICLLAFAGKWIRIVIRRGFCEDVKKMVRVLNVAEKNDAAKSISEVLTGGRYRKREGFSRFNKIYEYEHNILNQNVTMTMTSVSGHLLGLDFVGQYRKWYSCSPVALFDVPVKKTCPQDYTDIKRTLEHEIRGCQSLIIWTDCDREGENIGFEVIQVCKAIKPNLPVYRARFSEITQQAIQRACRNLVAPDKNTSDAVDVRQELDLRIGASFTRFQTMRLQKIFPDVLADQLISYGSCQFPTLGFVVERYKAVQAFIPEPFWKIKVLHTQNEVSVEFTWKRNRLFDYMACLALYEQCIEEPLAKVLDVKGQKKTKWRPVALDTVELEKLASRKLHINAKETMKIAEKLYTQGYISYPRTETNIFPKELDLQGLVQNQAQDPNWGGFAQQVLQQGPLPRNGKKTDQAHPPIHPTKYTNNLQGNEKKIYEFVVRHFLACVSRDAEGFQTTVDIDIADEKFYASGLMITARNYLDVYPYEKWNAKEIPVYEKEAQFEPDAIELNCGETSPPLLLSEADLIALMDKHGIGTDATHAEHIETIKNRKYVGVRPDGRFVPGQLGMGLVEGYDNMGYEMSKPHLRAELEADLKKICEGTKSMDVVLESQVKKYKEVFIEACRQALKIDEALSQYLGTEAKEAPAQTEVSSQMSVPVLKCPLCGNDMLLKMKKDGKGYYIGCLNYPHCRFAIWLPDCVLEAQVQDSTCSQCGPQVHPIKFKFRRGSITPMIPTEYIGCVGGCDQQLQDALDIKLPRPANNVNTQQGSRPSQRDSGYNSSGSNTTPVRSLSTQAGQRKVLDMFTPNQGHSSAPQTSSNRQNNYTSHSSHSRTTNVMHLTSGNTGVGSSQSNYGARSNNFSDNQGNRIQSNRGSNSRTPLGMLNVGNERNDHSGNMDTGGSGNEIVCNCGKAGKFLTVRKEGPNTGRQFYKCDGGACNFFLWADEAEGGGHSRSGSDGGFSNQNRYGGGGGGNSSNQNRYGGGGGGYSSNQNRSYNNNNSFNNNSNSWDQNTQADGCSCKCGQTAKCLTVQKEGPNKGRQFYACPAPRGQGCNFFQWVDEDAPPAFGGGSNYQAGGGGSYQPGRGRGGGGVGKKRSAQGSSGPAAKKPRSCGLCGEEGHTKRTCPHK